MIAQRLLIPCLAFFADEPVL